MYDSTTAALVDAVHRFLLWYTRTCLLETIFIGNIGTPSLATLIFSGTVTCMEFYKSTHLLTGSEDHTVCIWRVHDWALLHMLGGHKAAVTSLRYAPPPHPLGFQVIMHRMRTLVEPHHARQYVVHVRSSAVQ